METIQCRRRLSPASGEGSKRRADRVHGPVETLLFLCSDAKKCPQSQYPKCNAQRVWCKQDAPKLLLSSRKSRIPRSQAPGKAIDTNNIDVCSCWASRKRRKMARPVSKSCSERHGSESNKRVWTILEDGPDLYKRRFPDGGGCEMHRSGPRQGDRVHHRN